MQNVAKFATVYLTDVGPLILPAQKLVAFITIRAICHSENNMNTPMMNTIQHTPRKTEFAMIHIITNSGFSWGQRENATETAVYYHRFSNVTLYIPCIFLKTMLPPVNELNNTKFIEMIKTPTCFGTERNFLIELQDKGI
jgi:hypothetical protein